MKILGKSWHREEPEWWAEFLQQWNYIVYLRVRKVAWVTSIYPILALPILWTVRLTSNSSHSLVLPICLTSVLGGMAVISAYTLFTSQPLSDTRCLTKRHRTAIITYTACFLVHIHLIMIIMWLIAGVVTQYLIGFIVYCVFFFRPSRIGYITYALSILSFFLCVNTLPFPVIYTRVEHLSATYLSGILSFWFGIVVSDSLFQARIREFLNQRTIEKQTISLTKAYNDIHELNEKLRAENFRMNYELSIARHIQEMILPEQCELDEIEFLEVAALMSPATEVGGDYFDVLVDNDTHRATIAIGDVTGHGLESGIFTVMLQAAVGLIHNCHEYSPKEVLNTLNKLLYHNAKRMQSDKCVTFVLLQYDRGKVKICGQHETIILVRHTGKLEIIDTAPLGFMLGLEPNISPFVQEKEIYLDRGDGLVLYTDGIVEAMNSEQETYGIDRLEAAIVANYNRSAKEIREAIAEDVMNFIGVAPIDDDITLLVIKQI